MSPTMALPTLEQLRRRHPEHIEHCAHWSLLEAVIKGGHKVTPAVKAQLLPNPDGRPEKVMQERIRLASYCNKIGPVLSRFNSELFSEHPTFEGSKDKFWTDRFFTQGALLDGDDDSRASFVSLLMCAMFMGLWGQKAIAQVDTRIADPNAQSKGDQQQVGELEPYVTLLPRQALWDWEPGEKGFLFTKLHRFRMARESWDEPLTPEHDFTIHQRTKDGKILVSRYKVRKRLKQNEKPPTGPLNLDTLKNDEVDIEEVLAPSELFSTKGGKFGFPVVTLTVPEALWMGDQLFEPQKSYFTQTAALDWGLYTSNYAMPVLNGVDDPEEDPLQDQKMGEGYYLTLKTGQSISWAERPGGAFTTAIAYRGEIKRDIYDVLQQIAMSAADGSAIIARSGESKKEDRRPEQLLLGRYGTIVKEFAKQILDVAAIAHDEEVEWKVNGLEDFLGEGLIADITEQQGLDQIVVPSLTFKKAKTKYLVRKASASMNFTPEETEEALKEVDAATMKDFQPPQPEAPAEPGAPPDEPPALTPQPEEPPAKSATKSGRKQNKTTTPMAA